MTATPSHRLLRIYKTQQSEFRLTGAGASTPRGVQPALTASPFRVGDIDHDRAPPPQFDLEVRTPRFEPRHVRREPVFVPLDFLTTVRAENLDGWITQLVALFDCLKNVNSADLRIEQVSLGVTPGAIRQFE